MSHVQKAIDELEEKRNEAIEYTTENRKSLDIIPEADDLDQLEERKKKSPVQCPCCWVDKSSWR